MRRHLKANEISRIDVAIKAITDSRCDKDTTIDNIKIISDATLKLNGFHNADR